MRAKMQLTRKTPGTGTGGSVRFDAMYGDSNGPFPENQVWAQSTPQASIDMVINNPEAFDPLVEGQNYFVDFTAAE